MHKSAWLLTLLSAALQILVFPLPNLYILGWIAVAPLLIALLRARQPDTLQLLAGVKLLPAKPVQAFLLAYFCGILWYAGTCYWIYNTMRQYGGVGTLAALGLLLLFCMYLAIYHGVFGLLISLLASPTDGAGPNPFSRRALLLAPVAWVAVELARTRITGFPWDLLGISQVDNIPLSHIATVTGVYGLSFEIMVVNTALAAAFRDSFGKRAAQQAQAAPAGDRSRDRSAAGRTIGQSAGCAYRPHGSSGAAKYSSLARQRLDERIFRRHIAGLECGEPDCSQFEPSRPGSIQARCFVRTS